MKKIFLFSLLSIFILAVSECKRVSNNYEIIDRKSRQEGPVVYTIYTPDTDWVSMKNFAKSLLDTSRIQSHQSRIFFFSPQKNDSNYRY
jgi:hypothetical protein